MVPFVRCSQGSVLGSLIFGDVVRNISPFVEHENTYFIVDNENDCVDLQQQYNRIRVVANQIRPFNIVLLKLYSFSKVMYKLIEKQTPSKMYGHFMPCSGLTKYDQVDQTTRSQYYAFIYSKLQCCQLV